ncbi:MAG: hypothetical protein AAGM84_14450 [Pseudomonadota bacterium]
MKICIFGDSHLAMFVKAAQAHPELGVELTPVSWIFGNEGQYKASNGRLTVHGPEMAAFWERANIPTSIDLNAFDRLVCVSGTVTSHNAFPLLRGHTIYGWPGAQKARAAGKQTRTLMTEAAFVQALTARAQAGDAFTLTRALRAACEVPIAVAPAPLLAETTLTQRPKLVVLKRVLNAGDGAALREALHTAQTRAYAQIDGVDVIFQPDDSVTQGCLTRETYRVGAARYGSGQMHDETDILHAGPALGKALLQQILELPN